MMIVNQHSVLIEAVKTGAVRCLGATQFGQDRPFLGLKAMHPLDWSCIDADQSETVDEQFFL